MQIRNEYELNQFMQQNVDFAIEAKELVSLDFLQSGKGYYTTGVHGISKAHFETHCGKLYCNPIQALIILSKAYALDRTEQMLGSSHTPQKIKETFERNYDMIKKQLWPYNKGAQLIKDPFYKRLFGYVVTHDTFRNVDNSKINKAVFDMEIIQHFACIDPIGEHYTEDEIRLINQDLYKEAVKERGGDSHGLSDITLCLVEEDVAAALKEEYGWKFTYREYVLFAVDWDVLSCIEAAFPSVAAAVREAADIAFVKLDDGYAYCSSADSIKLYNQETNPIAQTIPYKRLQENNYRKALELVGFSDYEFQVRYNTDKYPNSQYAMYQYLIYVATQFVERVERLRKYSTIDINDVEAVNELVKQVADHLFVIVVEHDDFICDLT